MTEQYTWTDNPTLNGVALCNTDVLNECLMHLKYKNAGGGLELCDIGTALFVDETKGLRRRLNGSILDINANTQAFLTRLLEIKTTNPDYFTDEATWQSEATLNVDGYVYKYVLNYDSTGTNVVSVRLPKFPDYVEVSAGGSITTAPVTGFVKSSTSSGIVLLPRNALNPKWDGSYALTSNGKYGHFDLYAQDGSGNVTVRNTGAGSVYYVDAQADLSDLEIKSTKLKLYYFIQIATGQETENNIVNDIELNNPFTFGMNMYFKGEMENISWLKSANQQNPKALCPDFYNWVLTNANAGKEGFKLSTASDITDYDFEVNPTKETFRLPLKNGMEGVFASGVKGNGITLGVTNGTSNSGLTFGQYGIDNRTNVYGQPVSTAWSTAPITGGGVGLTTDPTKSGIVVDTTVPTGYNLYYFVGVVVKNPNLIDAGRIGEELANCLTRDNKEEIIGWGIPDYSAGIDYANNTTVHTAPSNGILVISYRRKVRGTGYLKINGTNVASTFVIESYATPITGEYLLSQGDTFQITAEALNDANIPLIYSFYPFKGVN